MAQLFVRDVDAGLLKRLKARAKRHRRSLQGEVKVILIDAIDLSLPEANAISTRWQKQLAGRRFSDSVALIREDRNR